jgi:Ca-activated chloride channel family protein
MKFGAYPWLILIPLVVVGLTALWMWSRRRTRAILRGTWNTPLLARLTASIDARRRGLKQVFLAAGLCFLAAALARPQWGRREIELERTGVDLIIALDVSRSMLANDAGRTNRLRAATRAIQHLLEDSGGDRIGLVLFAGEAFVAAPLTRDHTAVDRVLSSAGPWSISHQGSDLGAAIKQISASFERAAQGPRTLLVVSDGEQLQGDAVQAAQAVAREGIRVHTAGVGSAFGAKVPVWGAYPSRSVRNAAGREVVSRRDESRLQSIASAGGGRYTRIDGEDSQALVQWFRETVANLPRTTEKRLVNEPQEQYPWPLAIALALIAGEWMYSERKRPKTPGQVTT